MTPPKPRKRITGGLQWTIPAPFVVQWWGPGCGLVLCENKPGGILTAIHFDGDDKFDTERAAIKAFAEYWSR